MAAGGCNRGVAGDRHGRFGCELLPVFLERRTHGLQTEQRSTDQILMLNKESDVAVWCSLSCQCWCFVHWGALECHCLSSSFSLLKLLLVHVEGKAKRLE